MLSFTKKLSSAGREVIVHGFSTGLVSVKKKFRETNQKGLLAVLSFVFDKEFTEWMPIWVWVIVHPEGVFVIDTGENAEVNNKDYFKSSGRFSNWLNTTQFKFKVDREEEADRQLEKVGINITDVNKVFLTHLHLDHIDGLRHFPNIDIYVNKKELDQPYGDLPKLYPEWFNPKSLELDSSYQVFDKAKALTETEDFWMVQTAGHTHGHTSYLLRTDQGYILFAGDVAYSQEQLQKGRFAGANVDFKKARETYAKIQHFGKSNKLVFVPSHDGESGKRILAMEPIYGKG